MLTYGKQIMGVWVLTRTPVLDRRAKAAARGLGSDLRRVALATPRRLA